MSNSGEERAAVVCSSGEEEGVAIASGAGNKKGAAMAASGSRGATEHCIGKVVGERRQRGIAVISTCGCFLRLNTSNVYIVGRREYQTGYPCLQWGASTRFLEPWSSRSVACARRRWRAPLAASRALAVGLPAALAADIFSH
jgi:hypothetical protein